jgi:hypothetical protein
VHASFCHLWPAPLYNIFPHYLRNGTILDEEEKKKDNEHKNVWFDFLHNLSHSRRTEQNMIKNVY